MVESDSWLFWDIDCFSVLQSSIEKKKSSLFFFIVLSNTLLSHTNLLLVPQTPNPRSIFDSSFSFGPYSKQVTKYCKSCFEISSVEITYFKVKEWNILKIITHLKLIYKDNAIMIKIPNAFFLQKSQCKYSEDSTEIIKNIPIRKTNKERLALWVIKTKLEF